jgi:CubicO group peptidase (beta-lactamase class C family)
MAGAFAPRLWIGLGSVLALVGPACSPTSASAPSPSASAAASVEAPPTYALGAFPEFPPGSLPESTAAAIQAVLDAAVEDGTFTGATAAVIVADDGSWTGAAGTLDGDPLTEDSPLPTHSAGKDIVAAQVLRLVEQGKLGLDDPASDHLPPELGFYDANGATVRQVLGMRSGIPGLNEEDGEGLYPAEQASTAAKVFKKLPPPEARPGSTVEYASTNYVLLGTIIEQATGRSLAKVLRSDVLDHPGLEGIDYTVDDALAGDGWGVEATPASLARWGYDLFGGFVLSDDSLGEMTDFGGEWYGLGVMDFSGDYGTLAVGHDGSSSTTTCCSQIRLVVLPEEGTVVSVQANTGGVATADPWTDVFYLTLDIRDAVRG